MEKAKLNRISELSRKSRLQGLTEDEKKEQQALRQEYLNDLRGNLRSTLENTVIVRPDGTRERVSERAKSERAAKEK